MSRKTPPSLPDARALAMAVMAVESRPLAQLDAEVRQVLGIKPAADGGKPMRLDLLHDRLTALIHDLPLWRERAIRAQRRLARAHARPCRPPARAARRKDA